MTNTQTPATIRFTNQHAWQYRPQICSRQVLSEIFSFPSYVHNLPHVMARSEMPRPTPFFATGPDVHAWLQELGQEQQLAFTLAGMFDVPGVLTYPELDAVPHLGHAVSGNQLCEPTYLIHDRQLPVTVREIPQRRGGLKFSVDQGANPYVVGICFGGTFDELCVIAGQLGPGTEHPISQQLRQTLVKQLKREFTFIRSYWVGPDASRLLDAGARLTINHLASEQYDLARLP